MDPLPKQVRSAIISMVEQVRSSDSQRFIEAMGGGIGVESQLSQGSTGDDEVVNRTIARKHLESVGGR